MKQVDSLSAFEASLANYSDWNELTGSAGYDGWYTFATPNDLTYSFTNANNTGEDIFLRGLQIVYNVRKQEIDVTATGNMTSILNGVVTRNSSNICDSAGCVVDYSLSFTDRTVDEARAAGFKPGLWKFSTMAELGGLTPDGDDIISITQGGIDVSNGVGMVININQYTNDSKDIVTYAGIGQSGSNSDGTRRELTQVGFTLGTPDIEEDETLGGSESFVRDDGFHLTTGSLTVTENIKSVVTFDTTFSETTTYSMSGSGTDSDLFSVTPDGALSFIKAPDFDNPADNGGDNVYDLRLDTLDTRTGRTKTRDIAITVTDLPTLNASDYSNTAGVISDMDAFKSLHTDHDSWDSFTGLGGMDGWYTFASPSNLTFTKNGINVSNVTQDILVDGLKVVYNPRTQLIDVTAVGNMTASSKGERITNVSGNGFLVDFSLTFTNRSVDEAKAAGFSPNQWLFATTNEFGNALLPDSDDVITITDLDGVDRSSEISMFLNVGTVVNDSSGLFVPYATVGQSGTDANGLRLKTTEVSFTVGAPIIEEDENLGGDSLIKSNQEIFAFTNLASVSIDEGSTNVATLTTNLPDVSFSLVSDSETENSNDLFSIDSVTGELIFKTALNIQDDNQANHTIVAEGLHGRNGIVQQIMSLTVNDIGNGESVQVADFSDTQRVVKCHNCTSSSWNFSQDVYTALETWEKFNYLAHSGIYTFTGTRSHLYGGPNQHGKRTDLLIYSGFKLIYDAKNALVDVHTKGDMITPTAGNPNDFIYFDLKFTNHEVSKFQEAGFTPGQFVFATHDNGTFEGILPDADDVVKISTNYNFSTDESNKLSMQVKAQILENTTKAQYTAIGGVSYKTTNDNFEFSDVETTIEFELPQPVITENE